MLNNENCIKRYKRVYRCSFCVLALSILCRIYFSNLLASENSELQSLYSEKSSLEKEMSKLSYVGSELSSLKNLEERALKLGFEQMKEPLVSLDLNAPFPIASLAQN